MSLGQNGQVGSSLLAAQDRVDVGNGGAAAAAVVGVVGDGEEAGALGQLALLSNLGVEVGDDGNVHGGGAGLDPVLAELVAVARVDGLDLVAQVVNVAHDGVKVPTGAALGDPSLHIMSEGTEGDEGVMGRAAAEDLCARVADMAVAHGLLGGAVVIVEIAAEKAEPFAEVEHVVEVEVRGTGLNKQDLALGKVGGQARGQDTASGTTSDNDVVEGGAGRRRESLGGSHGDGLGNQR